MYAYLVAWHFLMNATCNLHHHPESRNSLDGKSIDLHVNVYLLVLCFALSKSTCGDFW